ncbi:MAG: PSD1 and planctomycete cytochrome C domain-containing protein [Planctomycetota bacterium]
MVQKFAQLVFMMATPGLLLVMTAAGAVGGLIDHQEASDGVSFNRDVLPILAESCFVCHGFDEGHREAGLRLDLQVSATSPLVSGRTAIVPGHASASEFIRRIVSINPDEQMPPTPAKPLSQQQIQILTNWINAGAQYERHWAYQPIRQPTVPTHATTGEPLNVEHPIDGFVLHELSRHGTRPSPAADRVTLMRRVSLDLTGLPPTVEDVDRFVADSSEQSYEKLVDRLLASPHFGERWARWWLDFAHYGDSDGYLQDFLRPVAWRYRQWVIDAFNHDLPFDQFTIQQLAGDLLPDATVETRMGTGFLRNTLSNREGGADLEEYRINQVLDRTTTFATTWLGLTAGCAQCHDHKFDELTQQEFYELFAFFNDADEVNIDAPLPDESAVANAARKIDSEERTQVLARVQPELDRLMAEWEVKILYTEQHPGEDFAWDRTLELLGLQWGQNLGEGQLEGLHIIKTPRDRRNSDQQYRLVDYFMSAPPRDHLKTFEQLGLAEVRSRLDELRSRRPKVTRAPAMEKTVTGRPTFVHVRGDYRRRGREVVPDTPHTLPELHLNDGRGQTRADRLHLARWLVSPEHPLTARVTVNRLWQELFGRGLVATSENFGVRGDRPTHPELLDWLASDFIRSEWNFKLMLKTIIMSNTYQQSSKSRDDLEERDPRNLWLARQQRIRLSAEAIRDSALLVSGLLNPQIGGPSVRPPQPDSVSKDGYANVWQPNEGRDRYRRGIYTFLQRTSPFAQSVTFDLPDTSRCSTYRVRSNTPLQALTLLNDPVFFEMAEALAARTVATEAGTDADRIHSAFRTVLLRSPSTAETHRLLNLVRDQRVLNQRHETDRTTASPPSLTTEPHGQPSNAEQPDVNPEWITLASVLLNLDEFINRE